MWEITALARRKDIIVAMSARPRVIITSSDSVFRICNSSSESSVTIVVNWRKEDIEIWASRSEQVNSERRIWADLALETQTDRLSQHAGVAVHLLDGAGDILGDGGGRLHQQGPGSVHQSHHQAEGGQEWRYSSDDAIQSRGKLDSLGMEGGGLGLEDHGAKQWHDLGGLEQSHEPTQPRAVRAGRQSRI